MLQPVGDLSPMGLAWIFMGHSMVYNIFIGFAEVLGGLLMLFKKTVTLGSIIIIGVMTNVAMMNFTYDIPVKLFSIHLVLMATILMLIDGKRLWNFFFQNNSVEKVNFYSPFRNATASKILSVCKMLILVLVLGAVLIQCFIRFDAREQLKSKSEFYGIWETQLFLKNSDTLPPLLTDSDRWRYFIVDKKRTASLKMMTDSLVHYKFAQNDQLGHISLTAKADTTKYYLSYQIDSINLTLNGLFHNDSISVKFKRKPLEDFRLVNRKLHWVNEYPFNF